MNAGIRQIKCQCLILKRQETTHTVINSPNLNSANSSAGLILKIKCIRNIVIIM